MQCSLRRELPAASDFILNSEREGAKERRNSNAKKRALCTQVVNLPHPKGEADQIVWQSTRLFSLKTVFHIKWKLFCCRFIHSQWIWEQHMSLKTLQTALEMVWDERFRLLVDSFGRDEYGRVNWRRSDILSSKGTTCSEAFLNPGCFAECLDYAYIVLEWNSKSTFKHTRMV